MCRAPDKQKRAPWRVSAIHEFQLFGLYSLSEETNPYRMGSLVRDGQTHVQGIFVRQGACSGLEVPENRDKSTIQKWAKNRSEPLPQTQKTPIYRQILERTNSKKGVQNRAQNDPKIVHKPAQKRQPTYHALLNGSLLLLARQMLRQVRQRGIPAAGL
mgnify:CR=1 FL=1